MLRQFASPKAEWMKFIAVEGNLAKRVVPSGDQSGRRLQIDLMILEARSVQQVDGGFERALHVRVRRRKVEHSQLLSSVTHDTAEFLAFLLEWILHRSIASRRLRSWYCRTRSSDSRSTMNMSLKAPLL